MKPLSANLILAATYIVVFYCVLTPSSGSALRWLGIIGGSVVVSGMMMVKRPDTGTSILRYKKNGLYVPFYIP